MRQRGIYIAIALLLTVNAIVLAGAKYNRSGKPDAVMTLTGRELPIRSGYEIENSGISLRINTYHGFYGGLDTIMDDSLAWLDRQKLEALGFDFPKEPDLDQDYDYYNKQLPRKVYALLEYDGPAWEAWRKKLSDELARVDQAAMTGKKTAQELETARKNIRRALATDSHLFIVDAGKDPAALRRQYPDRQRYLILPAKVSAFYYPGNPAPGVKSDNVRGYVEILTSEVNVPHRMHINLGVQKRAGSGYRTGAGVPESGPRYQVVLKTGKRYEPWVEDIQPWH